MGIITINGKKVEFTNEKNLLTIIRNAGIEVPTLCYQPELSIFGACRLCTVEDDRGRCFASCSEEPRDGMVIYTHTERLRKHRKLIIELLLAAHCRDCTTCDKHGNCTLQKLAYQHGINAVRFQNQETVSFVPALYAFHHSARFKGERFLHHCASQSNPGRVRISGNPSSVMAMVCS